MRTWTVTAKKKSRIEIIPMIDVMMFLLVFFVLISVNVIPSLGVKTQQPSSAQAQQLTTPDKQVVVTLAPDGAVQVNGQVVALEGLAVAIRKQAGDKPAQMNEKISVIVNSDKGAEVQRLIDVMDALKAGGLSKVALASKYRSI